jgi:hypothetical protein
MAERQWLAGLLAYNLIRSVMVAPAARFHLSIQVLSFARTRDFVLQWIWRSSAAASGIAAWERLLACAAGCRHPRRKKIRPAEPCAKRFFAEVFPALKGNRIAARRTLKKKS